LGKNQETTILEIGADSYATVVLRSKAGAHRSLINERTPYHIIRDKYGTSEMPVYN
jgi:hypothetical protein